MRDFVIVGWWWAGYTAWIYAIRYGIDSLLIASDHWGMIANNPEVENYPGFIESIEGGEIMDRMMKQSDRLGLETKNDRVKEIVPIDKDNLEKWYKIKLESNDDIKAKSLLLAIWTHKRKLWVPGEKEFRWKWVSYCATCDGFFYKDQDVAVIWGWDSAFVEALHLSDIANKVYLIHRRDYFKAEPSRIDKVKSKDNIEIIKSSVVEKINWDQAVNSIQISKAKDHWEYPKATEFETKSIKISGVFIAIGTIPNRIKWLDDILDRDRKWYIKVKENQATSLPWVYAAWDVTDNSHYYRQLITACSEWAIAARWAYDYLV